MWQSIWIFSFIGFFIIAVTAYDYADKKKRHAEIKTLKYFLAIAVGLVLALPIISGLVLWLLGLPL
ncbi:MAG: hypothetical protein IIV90_02405 [Oscillospiraceae bacterium]|nr:hypothetical protein [Oscillospiraceae bacterium]